VALACALLLLTACRNGDESARHVTGVAPVIPAVGPPPVPVVSFAISRVLAPDTLGPGSILTLEGSGFAPAVIDNEVALRAGDGTVVHGYVEIASATRLDVRLPAADGFPCLPTGAAVLRLTSGGRTAERPVVVAVARRLALASGESSPLLDAAAAACTELVAGAEAATYAFAVLNVATSDVPTPPLTLRAQGHPAGAPSAAAPVVAGAALAVGPAVTDSVPAHERQLAEQARIVRAAGSALAAWRTAGERTAGHAAAASRAPAAVRVPSAPFAAGALLPRTILPGACHQATRVVARVVYAGTHSVILEDTSAPRAGAMDAELIALGREYDDIMHPALVAGLGDPLALEAAMQGDGRITVLVSGAVSQVAPGMTGFVSACNLYPRAVHAESNEDALLYLRAPHAGEAPAAWRRIVRSTLMHEAKHLASFAERLARGAAFEEPWLEEGTARIAEELYARTFAGGGAWRGNGGWADVVRCEVYQCDGRPLMLWKHFPVLHDYLAGVATRTPLGATDAHDHTFYASGWSLVRWAADHHAGGDEPAFLRALVRGTTGATGVTALSRLTGRPAAELLADWTLAQWLDDRPGFAPDRPALTFPSWHLPDIMLGLSLLDPQRYRAAPAAVADVSGDRVVAVPPLRGWSASLHETRLAAGATQRLSLRGVAGGAPPAGVRVAVVRVR
jgi:hypothetical protein